MTSRALFWLQVIAAWTYTFVQSMQVLSGQTKGLTLAMWILFVAYLAFSLTLAIASYRQNPSVERKRTISIFVQFTLIFIWLFAIGLRSIQWTNGDTVVVIVVIILSLMTIHRYKGIGDPIGRGFITIWCKSLPQLWMAYVILADKSSEGTPVAAMIISHVTSTPRLIQVYHQGRQGGWDRPTIGLLMGEVGNVATWYVVTVVWFIMR